MGSAAGGKLTRSKVSENGGLSELHTFLYGGISQKPSYARVHA